MLATVNKSFFLAQALPILDFDQISVAAYGGVVSVASFGNAVNFRAPAYIAEAGQTYLTADEWREVVQKVQESKDIMADIVR